MGLFELSAQVRKIIAAIGLILLALFILWLAWIGLRAVFRTIFPSGPQAPPVFFGKLSPPPLPKTDITLKNTSFTLGLEGGTLPETPSELLVYQIARPPSTIPSLDEASNKANSLDFSHSPKKLSEVSYEWIDSKNKARTLKINIVSGELVYKYDSSVDSSILKGTFGFDADEAVKMRAVDFLKKAGSYPAELDEGSTKTNFYKQSGKKRTKEESSLEANVAEVLFFRKQLDGAYDIVSGDTESSLIKVILTPNQGKADGILEATFIHWNIDFENPSSYPIKSAADAYQQFQDGKASFVKGSADPFEKITVNNISLAYFETKTYQPYLQPIFVFEGVGAAKTKTQNFVAYLPAVTDEYIEMFE